MECIFTLKYDVGDQRCDPNALVERLGAAGTDSLVGMGEPDYLALEFTREVDCVESVKISPENSGPVEWSNWYVIVP